MSKVEEHLGRIEGRKFCRTCPSYSRKRMFLNDTPAIITWFFGSLIMINFGIVIVILYVLSCALYVLGFAGLLCTYCPLYNTSTCTTGFGYISARLFEKKDENQFARKFRTFIPLLSLLWFIPFAAGIYLLLDSFSWLLVGLLAVFAVFGFVLVPFIPMLTYCRKCPLRTQCPWQSMSKSAREMA